MAYLPGLGSRGLETGLIHEAAVDSPFYLPSFGLRRRGTSTKTPKTAVRAM